MMFKKLILAAVMTIAGPSMAYTTVTGTASADDYLGGFQLSGQKGYIRLHSTNLEFATLAAQTFGDGVYYLYHNGELVDANDYTGLWSDFATLDAPGKAQGPGQRGLPPLRIEMVNRQLIRFYLPAPQDYRTYFGNGYREDVTPSYYDSVLDAVTQGMGSSSYTFVHGALNEAIPGVPEPATWLALLGGFGVVGSSLRVRRKARQLA